MAPMSSYWAYSGIGSLSAAILVVSSNFMMSFPAAARKMAHDKMRPNTLRIPCNMVVYLRPREGCPFIVSPRGVKGTEVPDRPAQPSRERFSR